MKLIAVADLPDGANVQVQGLLVLPQTPAGITAASPAVVQTRPLAPPDVAQLFVELCRAGMVEVPMQMPDSTVVWRTVTGFQFRLRAPQSGQNGAGDHQRRIITLEG